MVEAVQTKGPALSFDKSFLFMKGPLDTIQQDLSKYLALGWAS